MISAMIFLVILMKAEDKVERYIKAVVVWTLFCYTITQILSMFYAICTLNLWICWITFDILLVVLIFLKYKSSERQKSYLLRRKRINRKEILGVIFVLGMVFFALYTMPYNWDSMTYHLPRIYHWLQNGSVQHYATHNDRQVVTPGLGGFVNLHVYAMTNKSELFLNLLQCCSYLTNGVLVYYLAKKINCAQKYCFMAMVLFYSLPIAFAEALTTQTDNYAALWMICFAYLLIDLINKKKKIIFSKETLQRVINLSLCIAFGYLAKPSVCIGMVVFALWLLIATMKRKDNIFVLAIYLFIASGILVIILAPEFARNIVTYSALSAPDVGERQIIGSLHPNYILVNCMKNFTFNMPTIWLYNSTEMIYKFVMYVARILAVDINNPAIAEFGREFVVVDAQLYTHNSAVNPIIVWLLIASFLGLLLKNRKRKLTEFRNQYFIVAFVSFIAFCSILVWEPYVSRYMISYFAILCPAIMGQVEMFFCDKDEKGLRGEKLHIIEAGFVAVFYFLCFTESLGMAYYHGKIAMEQTGNRGYFASRVSTFADEYIEIVDIINSKGSENIGLITGVNSYEYTLMAMLNHEARIEHVNVMNATVKYENQNFIPDIIMTIDYDSAEGTIMCHGYEYELIAAAGDKLCLLEKKDSKHLGE